MVADAVLHLISIHAITILHILLAGEHHANVNKEQSI